MEESANTPAQILRRLPEVLNALHHAQPQALDKLTKGRVSELLRQQGANGIAGVYVFGRRSDGIPVYVGRSANLPQRLGQNHRSTLENQAAVTKGLKDKLVLQSMKEARDVLYRDYDVRFINEPDTATRAMLEIYASLSWDTEFNTFMER
jgi:hypothetical protein